MIPVVIDAGAPGNSKMLEAGPEACWLWFQGLCWCRANARMRGRIPKAKLASVGVSVWKPAKLATLAARLVKAVLWHDEGDAYRIHEYEQGDALIESLFAAITAKRAAVQTPSPIGEVQQSNPPVQSGAVQSKPWTTSEASSSSAEPIKIARDQDRTTQKEAAADAVQNARATQSTNENRSVVHQSTKDFRVVDRGEGREKLAMDCGMDCPDGCDRSCIPESMRDVTARESLRLRTAMAGVWDRVGGMSTSGINRNRISVAEPALRMLASEQGLDPLELFKAGTVRFKADPEIRRKHFGLPVFLSQITTWCAPPDEATPAPGERHTGLAYQEWKPE